MDTISEIYSFLRPNYKVHHQIIDIYNNIAVSLHPARAQAAVMVVKCIKPHSQLPQGLKKCHYGWQ